MSATTDKPMDDLPVGFWKWAAGGLFGLLGSAAMAVGGVFRWHMGNVREEIKEVREDMERMDKRHKDGMDDLWAVLNTEREEASRSRERIYGRLEQTPTRDEMQRGFERLEAAIRGKG